MSKIFKPQFFINNRTQLLAQVKSDAILIAANSKILKTPDNTYQFKQEANFWYLTGIDDPDLMLLLDAQGTYLIKPRMTSYQRIFEGELDDLKLAKTSGIKNILTHSEGQILLKAKLKDYKSVAILGEDHNRLYVNIITQNGNKKLKTKIKRFNPKLQIENLRPVLAGLRMIKSPEELRAIRKAVSITKDSLNRLIKSEIGNLHSTNQVDAWLDYNFRLQGATTKAFDSVIVQGQQACTIHYPFKDQILNQQELLLIDCGAEYSNYAADISRTFALGKMSNRQKIIYDAVARVQHKVFNLVKPGLFLRDLEQEVVKLIGKELLDLKLIPRIDERLIRDFYPHAFSHSMGLDVHDSANYRLPLAEGMVITVEPGIYIQNEGIAVRIEDDVLITKDGIEIL